MRYEVTWVTKAGLRSPIESGQVGLQYHQAEDLYEWLMAADITEEITLWANGRTVANYDSRYWTSEGEPRV